MMYCSNINALPCITIMALYLGHPRLRQFNYSVVFDNDIISLVIKNDNDNYNIVSVRVALMVMVSNPS